MAWNEPGGGNNKDPWGGRDDQGPPDLDEVVKKMQDKLGGLFGGGRKGGSGGSSGSGGGPGFAGLGLVAGIIAVVWAIFRHLYCRGRQAGRGHAFRCLSYRSPARVPTGGFPIRSIRSKLLMSSSAVSWRLVIGPVRPGRVR